MASFPELIGEATTGKAKMWSVKVTERASAAGLVGVIETTHGYVDGKKQINESCDDFCLRLPMKFHHQPRLAYQVPADLSEHVPVRLEWCIASFTAYCISSLSTAT